MDDDAIHATDDDLLRTLIDETVARAVEVVRVPRLIPGTVTSPAPAISSVSVVIDGDSAPIITSSIVGSVTSGDRVMVLFYPPSGSVIIGRVGVELPCTCVAPIMPFVQSALPAAFSGINIEQTIASMFFVAPTPGVALVSAQLHVTKTVAADRADMRTYFDGNILSRALSSFGAGGSASEHVSTVPKGVAVPDTALHAFSMTVQRVAGGTGTLAVTADSSISYLTVQFLPG